MLLWQLCLPLPYRHTRKTSPLFSTRSSPRSPMAPPKALPPPTSRGIRANSRKPSAAGRVVKSTKPAKRSLSARVATCKPLATTCQPSMATAACLCASRLKPTTARLFRSMFPTTRWLLSSSRTTSGPMCRLLPTAAPPRLTSNCNRCLRGWLLTTSSSSRASRL